MTGQESGFRAPIGTQHGVAEGGAGDVARTPSQRPSWEPLAITSPTVAWVGGRIALVVAGIGLLGAAFGGAWVGLADRYVLSPGSLAGSTLLLIAVALLVAGAVLLVGGLGYYVLAPGFIGGQMAWHGVGSHRLVIATTILIVLLANAGPLAYMALVGVHDLRSLTGLLTAALSVDLALLGITYVRFVRPGILTAADLGLDLARVPHHVGVGLLVGLGVLLVSGLIQAAMRAVGIQQTQLESLQYLRDVPFSGFLAVVLTGGVLAPIAEELYFRGFVFRSYFRTRGPLVAYGLTSLLFSTLHFNLQALVPILVLSVIFCWVYRRTGSILPSIVGHAVNNSAAFGMLYFTSVPLGG
jgi:membrane protease YdiL (CAAX protease family)